MSTNIDTSECFMCRGEPRYWHTVNDWDIVRCPECGTAWLDPMPTEEELKKMYEAYYLKYPGRSIESDLFKSLKAHYSGINKKRLKHLTTIAGSALYGKRLLDIGSANGLFMKDASEMGMIVEGIEISHTEAEESRQLVPSATVYEKVLEDLNLPSAHYDVVTGWDVLEHVTDQRRFMKELRRIMKPGGIFAASTINVKGLNRIIFRDRWGFFIPPEHVVFYSAPALKMWFEKSGWDMRRLKTFYAPQLTLQGLMLMTQKSQHVQGFNTPTNMAILRAKKLVAGAINAPLQHTELGDILEFYAQAT